MVIKDEFIYKIKLVDILRDGQKDKKNKLIKYKLSSIFDKFDITYNDCLLFDQIRKELPDVEINEVLVKIDFNDANGKIDDLLEYENGIEITLDKNKNIYVPYIKSNSMSRSFECYYINNKYFKRIDDRISFGFNSNEVSISKWAAYQGLTCSSATICDDIHLTMDEVAIVEDKEIDQEVNCVTAISIYKILEILDAYHEYDMNLKSKIELYDEAINKNDLIDNSLLIYNPNDENDKKNLSDLKNLLKEVLSAFDDKNSFKNTLNEIKEKYKDYKGKIKIKWFPIVLKNYNIKVNLFDGVGLITKEFAKEIMDSLKKKGSKINNENNYSFQIRLPFLKGMVHACDIQQFFKDKGETKIKSVLNFKSSISDPEYEYKDVSKIKMIITESQFKASKYLKRLNDLKGASNQIEYYFNILNKYQYSLAIANKETNEYKKGKLNYQFLTTLPLDDDDVNIIVNIAKQWMDKLTSLDEIKTTFDVDSIDCFMANEYPEFYQMSGRFKEKQKEIIEAEREDIMMGRVRLYSSRRYLSPDLLELLYYCIGKVVPENETLSKNKYYAPLINREKQLPDKKVSDKKYSKNDLKDEKTIILRNPHYSKSEIVVSMRDLFNDNEREKYFNHLYGVLMINPLSLYAERLGGADYDGDSVLMVNHGTIGPKIYHKLANEKGVINELIAKIPSLTEKPKELTYENRINSLKCTFSNQTGAISNMAFLKSVNKESKPLPNELTYFTILSGLEIDSLKNGLQPVLPKKEKITSDDNLFINVKDAIKNKETNSIYRFKSKSIKSKIKEKVDDHLLYKIQNELLTYKPNIKKYENINVDKYFNIPSNFETLNKPKIIGLLDGYNYLIKHNSFKKKRDKGSNENIRIIKDVIQDTLPKSIEFTDFINYFKTDNPSLTLNTYLDSKFYFKVDKLEKETIIKNKLKLSLPDCFMDYVTDFKKYGFKLLYLSLLYLSETYNSKNKINTDNLKLGKQIEKLNEEDKSVVYETAKSLINYVNEDNGIGNLKFIEVQDKVQEYVMNHYNDISFKDINASIDIIKNKNYFDVFKEIIQRDLRKEG